MYVELCACSFILTYYSPLFDWKWCSTWIGCFISYEVHSTWQLNFLIYEIFMWFCSRYIFHVIHNLKFVLSISKFTCQWISMFLHNTIYLDKILTSPKYWNSSGKKTLQHTSLVGEMMIFVWWQLPEFFWNEGVVGLVMDNTPITWKKWGFHILKKIHIIQTN